MSDDEYKEIRRIAFQMDVSPKSAQELAEVVGIETTMDVLEKVRKLAEREEALPAHPRKKTNGHFFAIEDRNCRLEFQAHKQRQRHQEERASASASAGSALADGFQPDEETLLEQLQEKLEANEITYDEFRAAKTMLIGLNEPEPVLQKEKPDVSK